MNQSLDRPRQSTLALVCLYIALGASALRAVFMEQSILTQTSYPVANSLLSVLFLVITLFLVYMIGKGRVCARTVYLIWFIISLPVFGMEIYHLAGQTITGSLGILATLFNLSALILLFRKESSDWFRAVKNRS